MRISCVIVLSWAAVLAVSASARADEFVHEANVMAKLGNHPNVVHFIGATTLEVTFTPSAEGTNPLYEGQILQGENPFYEGSADPGTPGAVQWITFELDNAGLTPHLHSEGIVHRDIAARNFRVQTNGGLYGSDAAVSILFGNDGPPDLRTTGDGNVGPVRWMAPESIRLYPLGDGDVSVDDWIEVQAGSSFSVTYVPEPASLSLLLLAGAPLVVRRRA